MESRELDGKWSEAPSDLERAVWGGERRTTYNRSSEDEQSFKHGIVTVGESQVSCRR
jgi:hypothetical protein